jgi:hypothetical protein
VPPPVQPQRHRDDERDHERLQMWESWRVGKREMDDEQRERMHDLKRWTWWGVLIGGAQLVLAIVAGVFLRDDWSAFLYAGSLFLVLTIVMFVSQWRYIRRGPFPRLPVIMGDATTADPSARRAKRSSADS